MTPSTQQTTILKWVKENDDNLIVEAVAGSGKTTTLDMIIRAISEGNKVLTLAFSKEIATAMEAKNFPKNVDVRTFHALGLNLLRTARTRVRVNGRKVENLFKYQVLGYDTKFKWKNPSDAKVFFEFKSCLCETVSHVKNRGLLNEQEIVDNLQDILTQYQIDIPELSEFYKDGDSEAFFQDTVLELWNMSNASPQTVDFDDMIYLPLVEDLLFPVWDIVLVDEAQDLNKAQRMFLRKLLGGSIHTKEEHNSPVLPWIPTQKRTIVVGDTAQAIYGFRGASLDSMRKFSSEFSCIELPLSVCYRCDTEIVKEAKKYVEEISARGDASLGAITEMPYAFVSREAKVGDAILCRFNAPLLDLAFLFWSKEQDIVLTNLRLKDTLLKELSWMKERHSKFTPDHLEQYIKGKVDKLEVQKKKWALANFRNLASCLRVIQKWADTYEEAEIKLEELFDKKRKNGIILSTIHKAKGLEWDRVFILPERADGQTQEEKNLLYVAITRARHQLFYVGKESGVVEFIPSNVKTPVLVEEMDRIKKETLDGALLPEIHRTRTNNKLERKFEKGEISMQEKIRRCFNK